MQVLAVPGEDVVRALVHLDVQTPTRLDERQQELLRELAALRGEDLAEGSGANTGGLFSRVRDAFK